MTVNSREQPFGESTDLVFDPEGHLLLNEWNRGTILRLSLNGEVSIVVNQGSGVYGLAVHTDRTVFYSRHELPTTSIRKLDADGAISTVFEDVPGIYGGTFSHNLPGLAVAPDGTLYTVDQEYGRVVRISPEGKAAIVVDRQSFNDSPSLQAGGDPHHPGGRSARRGLGHERDLEAHPPERGRRGVTPAGRGPDRGFRGPQR